MVIFANFLAVLFILALVGLIAVIVMIALVVKDYIAVGKRAAQLVNRPKDAAVEVYNTGKGQVLAGAGRVKTIIGHVKTGAVAVKTAATEVSFLVKSTAEEVEAASNEANAFKHDILSTLEDPDWLMGQFQRAINAAKN